MLESEFHEIDFVDLVRLELESLNLSDKYLSVKKVSANKFNVSLFLAGGDCFNYLDVKLDSRVLNEIKLFILNSWYEITNNKPIHKKLIEHGYYD